MVETIANLTGRFAQPGTVRWIGTRPARRVAVIPQQEIDVTTTGITGDHRATAGKRTVTLIQWEHLAVIAALAGQDAVDPALLRRNIAVGGINLLGLRNRRFQIGDVVLHGSGLCAPCSRMEEALGPGGYNAMRGHGGICAAVLTPGPVRLGDPVNPLDLPEAPPA